MGTAQRGPCSARLVLPKCMRVAALRCSEAPQHPCLHSATVSMLPLVLPSAGLERGRDQSSTRAATSRAGAQPAHIACAAWRRVALPAGEAPPPADAQPRVVCAHRVGAPLVSWVAHHCCRPPRRPPRRPPHCCCPPCPRCRPTRGEEASPSPRLKRALQRQPLQVDGAVGRVSIEGLDVEPISLRWVDCTAGGAACSLSGSHCLMASIACGEHTAILPWTDRRRPASTRMALAKGIDLMEG